ncbi:uncharacterized protein LY89DRAFT_727697 [Mollisia scopiformis]|uniref:2EXR domain-containing protein n=1 Tax=Mollisia scopiformis TaxID=149040 RepID=A0A194XWR0_MOLSC|nr:uncharacterized protein LY89DRAFT_727697 [Mollisia scopiformis]KUJ24678.1 hypothetical protein LY89DRAFT_727697 [Mollisia scopiformis]
MVAAPPKTILETFEKFELLPVELKTEIWGYVSSFHRRRLLQVVYDTDNYSWQIRSDSLCPDPISQVNQEARKKYTAFLDVAILPHRDIIFVSDPKFNLRPLQNAFFTTDNIQLLQHVSLAADVWQGMRHTNHEFPAISLSLAGVLRKFTALTDFYLAVSEEDESEIETASNGYEGEWIDDEDFTWDDRLRELSEAGQLDPTEIAELRLREERRANEPQQDGFLSTIYTLPPLERHENGDLTRTGRADKHLRSLEEEIYIEMTEKPHSTKQGILRLVPIYADSFIAEHAPYFRKDVQLVFRREQATHPDWEPPAIHIRYLEEGEMLSDDEEDVDNWDEIENDEEDEVGQLIDFGAS